MATLTVVATVEEDNVPPRVKLEVTDTGSPEVTSVTVTRLDPDGYVREVRTEDGAALTLQTSGSNRVGTVYDYEPWFGLPATYSLAQDESIAETVTVNSDYVWLIHPGVPSLSTPIALKRGSFDEEEEPVAAGVFFPLGRRNAVVITDGKRKAPSGTLIVGTETPAERAALRDILADAFPLMLNVPPLTGLDVDTCYVHIGAVRRLRPSDIGTSPLRNWVLPFQVVDMPVGGSQSEWTYQSLLDTYATYQDVLDNLPTYADVLAPTT